VWSCVWDGTCARSIGDESAIVRLTRGLTEEEKVDAGDKLQFVDPFGEQDALKSLFGFSGGQTPSAKTTGSGSESHQGRLDPDSRPGAEKFRASSS
jgi:hypothetical protein